MTEIHELPPGWSLDPPTQTIRLDRAPSISFALAALRTLRGARAFRQAPNVYTSTDEVKQVALSKRKIRNGHRLMLVGRGGFRYAESMRGAYLAPNRKFEGK